MDNVLNSIKKLLGMPEDYTAFDSDITMHINTVMFILSQMGIVNGTTITNESKWTDILTNEAQFESVKTYMFLKVKMIFDPPTNSVVTESYNRTISELEWRMSVMIETPDFQMAGSSD